MKKKFNKEEITIMSFYNCSSRSELINKLESIVDKIEESEVKIEVEEIINKLKSMTDIEFKEIDFKEIIDCEYEE